MGYFILMVVTFLIGFIVAKVVFKDDFDMSTMGGVLIALFVGGGLSLVIAAITHSICESEEYVSSTTPIVALNDNVTSRGQFFLGSGSIEGEMTYFYMIKRDKGLKMDKISADSVYITEEDRNDAEIEHYDVRFKNDTVEFWFPNWTDGDKVIKIPKGSVLRNYQIDLE